MSKKITKEVVDQLCAFYEAGKSIKEISELCGVSTKACKYKIRSRGFILPEINRKYHLMEDFFETIDTEEKAYWLGFISADGCLRPKGSLSVTLAPKDRGHLEKFNKSLMSNGPIIETTTTLSNGKTYAGYKASLHSCKLSQDLIDKMVTPRKSLTLKPYPIRADLARHYWRGFIDGDGCLRSTSKNGFDISLMGTLEVVTAFREWAQTLAPVDAKVSQQRNVYVQRVGRREALYVLLRQLYRDCEFFLDRKKRRAEEMLEFLDSYFAPLSKGAV